MRFPTLQEVSRYREMTTVFGGYNHQISCEEGQFFDMKNMTSKYFPVLSPRMNRGIVKTFNNPQGILDKEDVWWIDDKVLYKNGKKMSLPGVELNDSAPKTLAKMGAYIVIMPDKVWCNTDTILDELECGYMENYYYVKGVTFSLCNETGKVIEWHDAEYYKKLEGGAKDGDYMLSLNSNGNASLKIYSESTGIWMSVTSTYTQISAEGIGIGFEKDDGIKITANLGDDAGQLDNILVKNDGNGIYSTNTYIIDRTDNAITIPGIYKCKSTEGDNFPELEVSISREVPHMSFITECNNRLWGCSKDGHEIYCCKLGDVKNWNLFKGTSTDAWAGTIGSDGKFTGAITFLGYPMFFKEDCLIKISVSSTGGHGIKETRCRGVQSGSERSIAIINEILYYKSTDCICGYNNALPYSISDELGDVRYYDAVSGAIGDKLYVSMRDNKGTYNLFVYDTKNGLWCREDNTEALFFCRHKDDLYYVDSADKTLKSVGGTLLYNTEKESSAEGNFDWFVESGTIGYSSPDNKYVGRINLRITLEVGTNVGFFLQYDSSGEWEHKFGMSGKGTKTYSIPIIPKRCDHFKYRISGNGSCKIHSITKTVEEGSEG